MSNDFKKILVEDSRLNVSSDATFAVYKGAQNVTSYPSYAQSQSVNSHTYTTIIPSENVIVDRRVMWSSSCVLKLTSTGDKVPVGETIINLALTDALAPFPLHQMATTIQATINSTTVSVNIDDVLAPLLRLHDKRELAAYNSSTPVAFDTYRNYSDGVNANNNALGGFQNVADNDLMPRGAYPNVVVGSAWAGGNADPTGALVVSDGNAATQLVAYVKFTSTEPIMGLSPFTYIDSANQAGLYGLTTIAFQMNMGNVNRVWRSANNYIQGIQIMGFNNSRLLYTFLTPHPDQLIPSRNVLPLMTINRNITPFVPGFAPGVTSAKITTNALQLSSIPDKMIIFVRKAKGDLNYQDADFFLPITNVSINFANQSGILASATREQLYQMSRKSSYNGTFPEFLGKAIQTNTATGAGKSVPLSGSVLCLDFGRDLQINETVYAPSSIGQFNFQMDIQVENNDPAANISNYEAVVIWINSGLFVTERGVSQAYTNGLLSREDVLQASQMEPYFEVDVKRLVGGGFLDSLKSVMSKVAPIAKGILGNIDHPAARIGKEVLGMAGYGKKGKLSKHLME